MIERVFKPGDQRTDRQVDSRLAAIAELYCLLLAARRDPNEWKCHGLGIAFGPELQGIARHEGFEINWAPEHPCAASVRWVGV